MNQTPHPVDVVIDLGRVRANALAIKERTGRPIIAVATLFVGLARAARALPSLAWGWAASRCAL